MPLRVVTLTPWRPDGGPRDRLYAPVRPYVAGFGYEVFEGDAGGEVFSLARTWNHLAEQAGSWDAAVMHEADYFVTAEQVRAAVDRVLDGYRGQVYAYDRHVKLTEAATARFVDDGDRGPWEPGADFTVGRHRTGGPRVISRRLWDAVGGFDPRFVGWGYEDNDFRNRCYAIKRHTRVPGDLVNLWHPKHDPADPYWQAAGANHALLESLRQP